MTGRAAVAGSLALLALLATVVIRNAFTYPAIGGYDAQEYITYAHDLVVDGRLPEGTGVYHTPPGYPAVAGAATELGRKLGMDQPEHLGQLVSALAVVVTGALVFVLARVLWPARPLLWFAAMGFFTFLPTVSKAGAMFHPEALGMLVTAASFLVLAYMVRSRRYSLFWALVLGVLLGLGQLVRGWSLWALAVVVVVLAVVAWIDHEARRAVLRSLALAVILAAVIPAPWYVHQATRYSNPFFNRAPPEEFILARRPVEFYLDGGVPDVVLHPWSGRFNDRFWPLLYAETWGDYFGIWEWGPGRGERTDAIDATLARQSALGLLPSFLAAVGLVALVGLAVTRPREDPGRLIAVLPPIAAVVAILYLGVAYPSSDGDTVKGTYALAAVPALALCFGFAFERLARPRIVGLVLGVALVASALAMLPFLVW